MSLRPGPSIISFWGEENPKVGSSFLNTLSASQVLANVKAMSSWVGRRKFRKTPPECASVSWLESLYRAGRIIVIFTHHPSWAHAHAGHRDVIKMNEMCPTYFCHYESWSSIQDQHWSTAVIRQRVAFPCDKWHLNMYGNVSKKLENTCLWLKWQKHQTYDTLYMQESLIIIFNVSRMPKMSYNVDGAFCVCLHWFL